MAYYGKYGDKSKCSFHIESEKYRRSVERTDDIYYAKDKSGHLVPAYLSGLDLKNDCSTDMHIEHISPIFRNSIDAESFNIIAHECLDALYCCTQTIISEIQKIKNKYWLNGRIRLQGIKRLTIKKYRSTLEKLMNAFFIELRLEDADNEKIVCTALAASVNLQVNPDLSIFDTSKVIFEISILELINLLTREHNVTCFIYQKTYFLHNKLGKDREIIMKYLLKHTINDQSALEEKLVQIEKQYAELLALSTYHNLFKNQEPIVKRRNIREKSRSHNGLGFRSAGRSEMS